MMVMRIMEVISNSSSSCDETEKKRKMILNQVKFVTIKYYYYDYSRTVINKPKIEKKQLELAKKNVITKKMYRKE